MALRKIRSALFRLAGLFTRRRRAQEFDEEIAGHLDMHIADNMRRGMNAAEARRVALARLGGVQGVRQAYNDRGSVPILADLAGDTRYAARTLRRSPAFVGLAVTTLALGIAGPTVMFAMAKQWILDPLPFDSPDALLDIRNRDAVSGRTGAINVADFLDARRSAATADLAAYKRIDVRLTGIDRAERLAGAEVTANFFRLLGVQAALGRALDDGDDDAAHSRVAVISASMWRRQFAGESAVVGRVMRLEEDDYTIVGVLPETFQFTLLGSIDVWRPLVVRPAEATDRTFRSILGVGRLRPGRTIDNARAELVANAERLAQAYPETNVRRSVRVLTLAEEVRVHHDAGVIVPVMFAMMCCVLLVACVNVTNVTLARARARRQEVAVRLALGASRGRIVRQWIVEHVLLFVAASAIALVLAMYFAAWVTDSIPAENRQYLRNYAVLTIGGPVVAFALAIGALCGVIFGWLPAWGSARRDVALDLREAATRATSSRAGARLRGVLVVSEVALSLALLISAGLLVATARNVTKADVGFNRRDLLTFSLSLDERHYREPADVRAFYQRLIPSLAQLPGVVDAAAGTIVPFGDGGGRVDFFIDGEPEPRPADTPQAVLNTVAGDYGATLGMRLHRGRMPGASDEPADPKVVTVNETFVERHFAGRDPIGARLRFGRTSSDLWTIVGVVADVRNFETTDPKEPQAYVPATQYPRRDMTAVLRTSTPPDTLAAAVRAAVAAIDPREPVADVATMEARIRRVTAGYETVSTFVLFFGIVTLLLAGVGVYGVVSYSFAQRTREIGIRMALGARRADVAALVFGQVRGLLIAGVLPGLALAWGLGQMMEALLFGVTPTDWQLYAGMTLLLAGVALAAAFIPARRAMHIEPTIALRYE